MKSLQGHPFGSASGPCLNASAHALGDCTCLLLAVTTRLRMAAADCDVAPGCHCPRAAHPPSGPDWGQLRHIALESASALELLHAALIEAIRGEHHLQPLALSAAMSNMPSHAPPPSASTSPPTTAPDSPTPALSPPAPPRQSQGSG